jgi:hypothetical protein
MQRHGCRSWPACRPCLSSVPRCWARAGAHAVPADVPQAAPGPGAVLDRPGLHGRGRRGLLHGLAAADHAAARVAARAHRTRTGPWAWGTTACSSSPCARRWRSACSSSCRAPASAAACAPAWTTRGWPRAWASTSTGVPGHLRRGLGPGRSGRRAGCGHAGPGSDLSAQVHGVFPDRRARWAAPVHHRARCWPRLLLGIADVAGKYYVPKLGAFIVYALMIAILLWRPQGLFTREANDEFRSHVAAGAVALAPGRSVLWVLAFASPFVVASTRSHQRDRHRRAVRAVAGPDPGLHRHRVAGPRGLSSASGPMRRRCLPST